MTDAAAALAGFPVSVELAVAWGDMDSYRHVNNVVYFRYFENARLEYFRRLDWFEYEKDTGIGPILSATQARFRKALTYPDTISVGCRVSAMAEDRFTMDYVLFSHSMGVVAADGQGTIVSFHYVTGQKVVMPEEITRRVSALEATARPAG